MPPRSSLFARIASSRVKWTVFAVWVVVIFASFGSGVPEKYTDAQENESTSFLPGDAESTKALTAAEELQGSELAPAVIVYRREGGLTAADRQKIAADVKELTAKRFPGAVADGSTAASGGNQSSGSEQQTPQGDLPEGCGGPTTPLPGQPNGYAPFVGPDLLGGRGRGPRARLREGRRRERHAARPRRLLARHGVRPRRRAGGQGDRRRRLRGGRDRGLREHQRHPARRGDAAGDRPADPDLQVADLPLHPARRGHLRRVPVADARLLPLRDRGDDQRPVELDHVHPRPRRGHRLCAVDRRALSRGDAPRGGQVRRDAVGADLGRTRGLRQRGDGHRRPLLPVHRAGQRHLRPRPARRARRLLRGALDADLPAGAAADLRPPRLLAVRPAHGNDPPDGGSALAGRPLAARGQQRRRARQGGGRHAPVRGPPPADARQRAAAPALGRQDPVARLPARRPRLHALRAAARAARAPGRRHARLLERASAPAPPRTRSARSRAPSPCSRSCASA